MPVRVGLKYIEQWKSSMEKEVLKYEEEPVQKGQIVFYGPSNFTRWSAKFKHTPLGEAVVGKSGKSCCINRGFGSSNAEHQLYYYPRMVRPLEPKVLVYSGLGNYRAFGYSLEEVWELCQRVISYALTDFPGIQIYLCSQQHHKTDDDVYRVHHEKSSAWMKEFCENTPDCHFLNILDYEPLQRNDIFVEDGVHYNQEGYNLYADYFREALKKELDLF